MMNVLVKFRKYRTKPPQFSRLDIMAVNVWNAREIVIHTEIIHVDLIPTQLPPYSHKNMEDQGIWRKYWPQGNQLRTQLTWEHQVWT